MFKISRHDIATAPPRRRRRDDADSDISSTGTASDSSHLSHSSDLVDDDDLSDAIANATDRRDDVMLRVVVAPPCVARELVAEFDRLAVTVCRDVRRCIRRRTRDGVSTTEPVIVTAATTATDGATTRRRVNDVVDGDDDVVIYIADNDVKDDDFGDGDEHTSTTRLHGNVVGSNRWRGDVVSRAIVGVCVAATQLVYRCGWTMLRRRFVHANDALFDERIKRAEHVVDARRLVHACDHAFRCGLEVRTLVGRNAFQCYRIVEEFNHGDGGNDGDDDDASSLIVQYMDRRSDALLEYAADYQRQLCRVYAHNRRLRASHRATDR